MNACCEFRVPTYKRPKMLERCLRSLLEQGFKNWIAIVQDDSPDAEGEAVVAALKDRRIRYTRNSPQLGCCGNIDRAFCGKQREGGTHACVVEDDNWVAPTFLEDNLAKMDASGCEVLLRNQLIAVEAEGDPPRFDRGTTRGHIFGSVDRKLPPLEIRASILLSEGLSNGGIFWKLSTRVSFVVGPTVVFSPLQEFCRSLQVTVPVWFASEPLAYFSYPEDGATTRETLENRRFARGRQSILQQLRKVHGEAIIREGLDLVSRAGDGHETVVRNWADASTFPPCGRFGMGPALWKAWAKGWAKRCTTEDPLKDYWNTRGLAEIQPGN